MSRGASVASSVVIILIDRNIFISSVYNECAINQAIFLSSSLISLYNCATIYYIIASRGENEELISGNLSSWLEIASKRLVTMISHVRSTNFSLSRGARFSTGEEFPRSPFRIDFQNSPPIYVNLHNSLSAPACSNRFSSFEERSFLFSRLFARSFFFFFFAIILLCYFEVLFYLKSSFIKNFIFSWYYYL